jgi:hypothetical protein
MVGSPAGVDRHQIGGHEPARDSAFAIDLFGSLA